VFTTQPSNVNAGNALNKIAAQEEDAFGNFVSDSGSVEFTNKRNAASSRSVSTVLAGVLPRRSAYARAKVLGVMPTKFESDEMLKSEFRLALIQACSRENISSLPD
jgi:hypothetical protein